MNITSKWVLDDAYIQDYWNDWINYRSKNRKWSVKGGIFLILISLIIIALPIDNKSKPLIVLGIPIGIGIIIWHFYDKDQWKKLFKNAVSYGEENMIIFSKENLQMTGPTSKGEMIWKGVENIEKGKLGFFLILQKGLTIYIPYKSLDIEDGFDYINEFYIQSKTLNNKLQLKPESGD